MSDEHLIEALRQIKTIVDAVLGNKSSATNVKKSKPPKNSTLPESLPNHILALRGNGFFAKPKTFNEVHAKLEPTYPCDIDRVKVTCRRLQMRKELRKTSKVVGKKSQVAYVW